MIVDFTRHSRVLSRPQLHSISTQFPFDSYTPKPWKLFDFFIPREYGITWHPSRWWRLLVRRRMAVSFEVCVHGDACCFFFSTATSNIALRVDLVFFSLTPAMTMTESGRESCHSRGWKMNLHSKRQPARHRVALRLTTTGQPTYLTSLQQPQRALWGRRSQATEDDAIGAFLCVTGHRFVWFWWWLHNNPGSTRPGPGHGSLLARDIILLAQCSETCLIELNNYCDVGRVCGSVVPVRSWWFRDGCVCWCFACKLAPSLQFAFDGNERVWTFPLNRSTENGTICLIKGIANL